MKIETDILENQTEITLPDSVGRLDTTIRQVFPDYDNEQVTVVRDQVLDYVSSGIQGGFDIALHKQVDKKRILKVLQLMKVEISSNSKLRGGE